MMWWGWVIAGAILLGAELSFVNAQFYLVFVGTAAIVVGLVAVGLPGFAPWAQWAVFAVLALGSMVLFRDRVYRKVRGRLPQVKSGPVGGLLALPVALAPGESCQAEYGGSFWTVRNDSKAPIASGTRVRIASVQELTLLVWPEA